MADGGLKDCVKINTEAQFLNDANCNEKRSFICKCSEDTEWFEETADRGLPGDLSTLLPSETDLSSAKATCLRQKTWCFTILRNGTQFYLVTSSAALQSSSGVTAYKANSEKQLSFITTDSY
ncbi:Hypothetical predicted protein [Pelobates cultripes]|uniref:C-type lectin domain-containing protein n=1 Tax=Pelobates cultripes TaxID=61616 RepID=A0AAD1T5J0_PELCU|nr:Hypothetical predicted protein [Pelobates cultripes]